MEQMKQILIDLEVNRLIEAGRLTFEERENDILKRLLLNAPVREVAEAPADGGIACVTQLDPPSFGTRARSSWQVKFGDEVVAGMNLKDAYCGLLRLADQRDPHFFDRFSAYKGRTRRYAARSGPDLYLHAKHLARAHALEIVPGWFVDCNLSEEQVAKRARVAATACGLAYGKDVWIKDRGRTI